MPTLVAATPLAAPERAAGTVTSAPPTAPAQAENAAQAQADDALLVEPVRLLQAGQPEAALPLLDAALAQFQVRYGNGPTRWYAARDSGEQLAYLVLAATDMDAGRANKANAKILPSDAWPLAHYLKGYALVERGRLTEAKAELEQAIAISPYNSAYLSELAAVQQGLKDWPGMLGSAIAAEDAVAFSPEAERKSSLGRARRMYGFALIELGRLDDAEAKFRACLELDRDDKLAQNELAYIAQLRQKAAPATGDVPANR